MALKQEDNRVAALAEIRQRCGWKYYRWVIFRWWHRRLCLALALRESNRHALMYYAAVTRRLALALGQRLMNAGRLSSADDVFFLTTDEFRLLGDESARNWKALIGERRSEQAALAAISVPDFISTRGRDPRGGASGVGEKGFFRGIRSARVSRRVRSALFGDRRISARYDGAILSSRRSSILEWLHFWGWREV